MSTSGHSLYRPIKISDILSLGFEIQETEDSKQYNRICIKISKDKIKKYIDWKDLYYQSLSSEKTETLDYYYLYLDGLENRNSHDCIWSFTRYNVNSPALDYLLESLHLLGYKMKVEGEKFNYESWLLEKKLMEERMEKNLLKSIYTRIFTP